MVKPKAKFFRRSTILAILFYRNIDRKSNRRSRTEPSKGEIRRHDSLYASGLECRHPWQLESSQRRCCRQWLKLSPGIFHEFCHQLFVTVRRGSKSPPRRRLNFKSYPLTLKIKRTTTSTVDTKIISASAWHTVEQFPNLRRFVSDGINPCLHFPEICLDSSDQFLRLITFKLIQGDQRTRGTDIDRRITHRHEYQTQCARD